MWWLVVGINNFLFARKYWKWYVHDILIKWNCCMCCVKIHDKWSFGSLGVHEILHLFLCGAICCIKKMLECWYLLLVSSGRSVKVSCTKNISLFISNIWQTSLTRDLRILDKSGTCMDNQVNKEVELHKTRQSQFWLTHGFLLHFSDIDYGFPDWLI